MAKDPLPSPKLALLLSAVVLSTGHCSWLLLSLVSTSKAAASSPSPAEAIPGSPWGWLTELLLHQGKNAH